MFGWFKNKIQSDPTPEPLPEVTIFTVVDSNCPEMRRKYKAPLTNGRWIEIEFRSRTWASGIDRDTTAFLYQSRNKWLIFRINAIAENILDPELVPQVEKYVAEMIRLDDAYITSIPKEFVDSKGVKWVREEKT